jgi:hypothetical protein
MMTGVSAVTARAGIAIGFRIASGALALMVVAAGGFTVWYRQVYNVWPGQDASARVHWCGRDYQSPGGAPLTWRQITVQAPVPIQAEGHYPPLGRSRQDLLAAAVPQSVRQPASGPVVCAMVVYLRTGPDHYQAYSLEGGP